MEAILVIIYVLIFVFVIQKSNFFDIYGISKNIISYVFILKVVFGLLVWGVYTYYYTNRDTADVFKYFDASQILFNTLKSNPSHFIQMLFGINSNDPALHNYYIEMNVWLRNENSLFFNDNRFIIRLNTVMRFFSLGYFNLHTVIFSFISLIGLIAIYKSFVDVLKSNFKELFLAVFLIPSVLFWGSGVLKEALIIFSLGMLIFHFNKIPQIKSVFICSIMIMLLGVLKFYVLVSIMPSLIFIYLINIFGETKMLLKYLAVIGLVLMLGLNINKFTSIQNPLSTLVQKQHNFKKLVNGKLLDGNYNPIVEAGSKIEVSEIEPSLISFLYNAPQALINSFFRPFLWEVKSPIMIFSAIENIVILLMLLLCIIYKKANKLILWKYVLFCFSFAIIQLFLIGSTTPVMGAIVRYKILAIPFLLIAFVFILDKEKIKKSYFFNL